MTTVQRREALIDAAARQVRREAFLGSSKDRERAAKALIRRGTGAGDPDYEAVFEHVRKVALPLLTKLYDDGVRLTIVRGSVAEYWPDLKGVRPSGHPKRSTWGYVRTAYSALDRELIIATGAPGRGPKKLAPPPGSLLLRELGRAVDHALGKGTPLSVRTPELLEAWEKDRPRLDPFHAQPGPVGIEETFADLFSRFFRGDRQLPALLPELNRAWELLYDRWISDDIARNHPERLQRITKFLRAHVVNNPKLSDAAKRWFGEVSKARHGPWDRSDGERHVKSVREESGRILVETRWGLVPYLIDGGTDEGHAERCEAFLVKFVRTSARISPESRDRLEREIRELYGPWCAIDFAEQVRALIESRGRLTVKTGQGDSVLEAW